MEETTFIKGVKASLGFTPVNGILRNDVYESRGGGAGRDGAYSTPRMQVALDAVETVAARPPQAYPL